MAGWQLPGFMVSFTTVMLDCDHAQGLGASVRMQSGSLENKRYAISIRHDSTPAEVAGKLRQMADFIEAVNHV